MKIGSWSVIVAAVSLSLSVCSAYASLEKSTPNKWLMERHNVLRIAHRGTSGYAPENTMAAFEHACNMGADMIELDVQLSSDRHVVVIHDTKVNRTSTGKGKVHKMTLNQLQKLDAGSWYDSRFKGQRIPTLDEVLRRFGGKMPLLIEMKSHAANPGIEQKTADLIRKHGLDKFSGKHPELIVQSFHIPSLQRFHKILPDIPLAVLVSNPLELTDERIREFAPFANYVNPSMAAVNEEKIRKIHNAGMKVFVWDVQHLLEIPPLLQAGVDGIITDYPDIVPTHIYSTKVSDTSHTP
ncbi:MAG: glycerophosphodiester phosphodiesterase [Bacillota bacterium]